MEVAMHHSQHAAVRSQQRNICPMVIDLLMEFGAAEPSGEGTTKFFFDKPARKRLAAYAGALTPLLQEHLDIYAVVAADNKVVTVGHRYERIHRH
jgi:hypothetical protein